MDPSRKWLLKIGGIGEVGADGTVKKFHRKPDESLKICIRAGGTDKECVSNDPSAEGLDAPFKTLHTSAELASSAFNVSTHVRRHGSSTWEDLGRDERLNMPITPETACAGFKTVRTGRIQEVSVFFVPPR